MRFNNWKSLWSYQCVFFCGSKLCIQYKYSYNCEWNLDGIVTNLNRNKLCQIGLDVNIVAVRSSFSVPNNPNPNQSRDDHDDQLNFYKTKHEEDKHLFIQFMNNDIYNYFPPPVTKTYSQRKRKQIMFLMNNYPSNTNKRANIKPPKNIGVVLQRDESTSIMTSGVNKNTTTASFNKTSKVV